MGVVGRTDHGYDFNPGFAAVEIGRGHELVQHAVDFPRLHELIPIDGAAHEKAVNPNAGLLEEVLLLGNVIGKAVDNRKQGNPEFVPGGPDRHGREQDNQYHEQPDLPSGAGAMWRG
jgi:hypothetical protein